jgi:tetratricopeptide (TPR) repeat protein
VARPTSLALVLTAAVVGLIVSATAVAQDKQDFGGYCDALRLFSSNHPDEAIARLSAWSVESLRHVMPQTTRCDDRGVTPALAVVAITYMAVAREAGPPDRVANDLAIAESLLRSITPEHLRGDGNVSAFQENWYVVATNLMLNWTDPVRATRFSDRGLAMFKNSAQLHTLSGVATELRAHLLNRNLHDPLVVAAMPREALRTLLLVAEDQYRRALALDPHAIVARVHLGRVLFLRKEVGQARDTLTAATGDPAVPASWRYLAHLFAGAAAEFEHDLPRARTEYEAAVRAMPEAQTGYIALSFVEQSLGNEQRARQLIADIADAPDPEENNPWSEYENGRFDMQALAALRARLVR